jgi:hypothetical protein
MLNAGICPAVPAVARGPSSGLCCCCTTYHLQMLWRLGQHAMALQLARQACSVLKEQAPAISGPRSASSLLIELVDALMDIAVHSTNSADTAHEGGQDGTGMPIQGSRDPAGSSAAGHATSLLQVAHEALAHAQACHDAACGGKAQLGAALRAPDANRNVHSTNQHEAASSALQVGVTG